MTASTPHFYEPDTRHWLYFGRENEWPKSLSFMGGGLCPNRFRPAILYTVTVNGTEYAPDEQADDRREKIRWYREDGWQTAPVSEWEAGESGLTVTIRHTANRVKNTEATAVFTKITLTNRTDAALSVILNVKADRNTEIPLNAVCEEADGITRYPVTVAAGGSVNLDFAAPANGEADRKALKSSGGFDENYAEVRAAYDALLADLAQPVMLPTQEMVNSYRNSILVMRETMTRTASPARILSVTNLTVDGKPAGLTPVYDALNLYELFCGGENGDKNPDLQVNAPGLLEHVLDGAWLTLNDVTFSREYRGILLEYACPLSSGAAQGGTVKMYLDGEEEPFASATIDGETGGWTSWKTVYAECFKPIPAGTHRLTLKLSAPNGSDNPTYLFNLRQLFAVDPADAEKNLRQLYGSLPYGKSVSFDVKTEVACVPYRLILAGEDGEEYARADFIGDGDAQTVTMALPECAKPRLYLVQVPADDYEIRGSGGNVTTFYPYDRTFSHDVPNMAEQFIREGGLDIGKRILASSYYQKLAYVPEQNYLDAIPKYIQPYATLWQVMSPDERDLYFTEAVKKQIRSAAHMIASYMTGPGGLMAKGNTLDNGSDYLVVDNFAVLHGYASYRYLCENWGWKEEAEWASERLETVNNALNRALDESMERRGTDWYMCALDDNCGFWQRHENGNVIYDGNWLGTTFMMSAFPWPAGLLGMELGGTWRDRLDRSLDNAFELRKQRGDIPENSWGAWWGHEYGTVYNVGMSLGLLSSDKYRTLAVKAYEWLLENQTAPLVWAESFDPGKNAGDWTSPAADLETWGLGFNRQGLLEATVSLRANGGVIIGRGIPCEWTKAGNAPIEWKNIRIGDGKRFDTLKIETSADGLTVTLTLSGDDAAGEIVFDLPVMAHNIASASCGIAGDGTVTCPGNTKTLTVTLKRAAV